MRNSSVCIGKGSGCSLTLHTPQEGHLRAATLGQTQCKRKAIFREVDEGTQEINNLDLPTNFPSATNQLTLSCVLYLLVSLLYSFPFPVSLLQTSHPSSCTSFGVLLLRSP